MSLSSDYLLPRDATESERLNLQHKIFESSLGYLIHPYILSKLNRTTNSTLKIAGIGCGTGIWLREAAKVFPSANIQFTGLDISSDQFPPLDQRLPNTTFLEHDMLQPLPTTSSPENFDIVHARLIGQGFARENWLKVITNVTALINPGGYLQWIEPDHLQDAKILILPDPSTQSHRETSQGHIPSTPHLAKLYALSKRHATELQWDRETDLALELRSTLETNIIDLGIGAIREEIVPCDFDGEVREDSQQNALQIFAAAMYDFVERGMEDEEMGIRGRKDADTVLEGAKKELEQGKGRIMYRYFWRVVVARKVG